MRNRRVLPCLVISLAILIFGPTLVCCQGGTGKMPPQRRMPPNPPPFRKMPPPRKNPQPAEPTTNRGLLRTVNLQVPPDDKYSCNAITRTVSVQGLIDNSGKLVDWKPDRGCPTHLDLITKDLKLQRFPPAMQNGRFAKSIGFVDYVFRDSTDKNTSIDNSSANPSAAKNTPGTARKNQIGMELVYVTPGSFMMGSTNGGSDEKPVHQVAISQPFYIGRYEVTQAQWQQVMGSNPWYFKDCGGNCPVERVSWDDAQTFVKKLNDANDGFKYRLPTEAEWEYACRAGTTGDFYGQDLNEIAWYGDNSTGRTHPAGRKLPNAFGLYDMSGNVMEWCEDWYHPDYNSAPTDGSAWLKGGEQKSRVLRGGSWGNFAEQVRSANRTFITSPGTERYNYGIGFRVVAVARPQ